jgi:uncharacterized protein (TIGR00369 family)
MTDPMPFDKLKAFLESSPFHRFLGLELIAADPAEQRVVIRMPFRPEIGRGAVPGDVHGGPIASLIDTAGDFALVMMLNFGVPTINFRTDYLRLAVNTSLTATAKVVRLGKSIGTVDVEVHDDDGRLVAIGRGTYATRET